MMAKLPSGLSRKVIIENFAKLNKERESIDQSINDLLEMGLIKKAHNRDCLFVNGPWISTKINEGTVGDEKGFLYLDGDKMIAEFFLV